MKTKTRHLLDDLAERTRDNLEQAEGFLKFPLEILNQKPAEKSWSVLECIEHLNRYGDFYLAEIRKSIDNSQSSSEPEFKPGLLGDYFAKMMLPGEKAKKMKTFKDKDPSGSRLDKSTIEKFIQQQRQILGLLDKAREVSLNKTKTGISISSFLRLKLGDTFRVVIYHNQRHLDQAKRALMATGH